MDSVITGMQTIDRITQCHLEIWVKEALHDTGHTARTIAVRGRCTPAELRACVVNVGRARREAERALLLVESLESTLEEMLEPLATGHEDLTS